MKSDYRFYRNNLPSTDGIHQLACFYYVPMTTAPHAVVQISHGMCEYVRRYEPLAEYLCALGYIVCGNDHLGHGETARDAEELGYTVKGGGAEYLVDDVYALTQEIRTNFEELPVILLGHSMGSFIARRYLEKYPDAVDAAIISGTGGPESPTGFGKAFVRFLMFFFGEKYRSGLVQKIAFGSYNKHYKREKSPAAWVTRDKDILAKYEADPFCNFRFTLRGFHDLFTLLGNVSNEKWATHLKKDLPILMVSGDDDPVGNYGKGVKEVYNRLLGAGMTDVRLHLYEGARHEVFNELCRDEGFRDVARWLEEKNL